MALALWSSVSAASPRQPSGAELARAVERLSVVGNVLYVAAHPDDENTRLLAWLIHHERVRAAYLSLTRGEGGQNLIGAEQAPLLGVIRTDELLAARALDGAEQRFGLERDFGYSKTPEETLGIWGHDAALGDVVWAIRRFRPDVIVTRFSPDDRETHGHHTASAMLALEAWKAAADPKAFPEQLKWTQPWQARRIVWNRGVWPGAPRPDLTGFVEMDVGGYDALLGESYGELAARSRSMHKSQGFGVAPQRGPAPEYFRVLAGEPMKGSFLDGIDLSWRRVKGSEKLVAALARAQKGFEARDPAASIPALLEAGEALDALPENPWKAAKERELAEVIAACAGLYADAVAEDHVVNPGGGVLVTVNVLNRSSAPLTLRALRFPDATVAVGKPLVPNQPFALGRGVRVAAEARPSNPYWLDEPPSPGRWTVRDPLLVGLPEAPPLSVEIELAAGARRFTITRPIVYAWTDPVAGERTRPLEVLPAVTVNPAAPLLAFPDGKPKEVRVTVAATTAPTTTGELRASAPAGFRVEPPAAPFQLTKKGDAQTIVFHVRPPAHAASGALAFTATVGGADVSTGVHRIEYPHIPIETLSPKAEVRLLRFELQRGGARIGYVPGAGDEVAEALRQVGYDVTVLDRAHLLTAPLDRFDAIVFGVRAFNVDPGLFALHDRLVAFMQKGGVVLAQYNTQNRLSALKGDIGPYPFRISHDRVTDENAVVDMAENPILKTPNKIDSSDFAGWVQERGLYFADQWDARYETPLAMHDAGEAPKQGGLLVARVGQGRFVYAGLAFFRQLPAGVPGAFRLFANLLAHGR